MLRELRVVQAAVLVGTIVIGCNSPSGRRSSDVVGLQPGDVAADGRGDASIGLTLGGVADPGVRPNIVGGEPFAELPAVGAFVRFGEYFCTGTLIEPHKVLTAAHCLLEDPRALDFVVGSDIDAQEHVVAVRGARIHPQFDPATVENDIGVALLAADLPVESLALVESIDPGWVGLSLLYVGYGVDDGIAWTGAGTKRAVEMPITAVTDTSVVAGDAEHNACLGDSGGPALYVDEGGNHAVAAVISGGDGLCEEYTLAMRVDVHADWLSRPSPLCEAAGLTGMCDGDVLTWCAEERVHQADCAERGIAQCGWDDNHGWYACIDPDDQCRGESFEGRCEQGSAIWCDTGEVRRVDCRERGTDCDVDEASGLHGCYRVYDPCQGESSTGRCEGETLIRCDGQYVREVDCSAFGLICGDAGEGFHDCIVDFCGDVPREGMCEGDTLVWCSGNDVLEADCSEYGLICGADGDAYGCLVPPSGCGDVPAEGICEQNTLVACVADQVYGLACDQYDTTCGWLDDEQVYSCIGLPLLVL